MKRFTTLAALLLLTVVLLMACNLTPGKEPGAPPVLEREKGTGNETKENGESEPGVAQILSNTLETQTVSIERDPDVPRLPFPDNPDPAQCGIPSPWTGKNSAWLTGIYEGELIQPMVFLYDSHLRRKIVARAPHGAEVQILLAQSNPQLNYYMVKIIGAEPPNEGWLPAPFVSFQKPPPAS